MIIDWTDQMKSKIRSAVKIQPQSDHSCIHTTRRAMKPFTVTDSKKDPVICA